jgi:23S rRNA (guanosine2251-2'-O)-methyltransferase
MKSKTKQVTQQYLYGIHPVKEALIAQKRDIKRVFINQRRRNPRLDEIVSMATQRNIKITYVSSSDVSDMAQHEEHQHVVAHVSALPLINFQDMITSNAFIIICDQIVDPHNMGAIIRTALAAGATGLITPKDHCTPLSATVSKISSGAMEHLKIARVTNLVRCIKTLKKEGIWVFGLDGHAKISVYDVQFDTSLALVVGGEHKGIRRLVYENCDHTVHIPQIGPLDSLNASVAAGVAMYEIFRQRKTFRSAL